MRRVTIAVTGASGALYALRTLRALLMEGIRVDLIVSDVGWTVLRSEIGFAGRPTDLVDFLADRFDGPGERENLALHRFDDLASPLASGSVHTDGMVVVPCSMKTLAGIAHGHSSSLIERAADVMLKERRPLVLVPRETPLNLIHLRNMVTAAEAGAAVLPAAPAFYHRPETLEDLADFIAGRILNLLSIPHDLFAPWKGE